jgi:hypothetical protein
MTNKNMAAGMGVDVLFTRCRMNGVEFTMATTPGSKKSSVLVGNRISKYIKIVRS